MRKSVLFALCALATAAVAGGANAAQGCGPGLHRGIHGRCFANHAGVVVAPGVNLVVGTFYPGQGYWDGHRYWGHRERWHGGWRYR